MLIFHLRIFEMHYSLAKTKKICLKSIRNLLKYIMINLLKSFMRWPCVPQTHCIYLKVVTIL